MPREVLSRPKTEAVVTPWAGTVSDLMAIVHEAQHEVDRAADGDDVAFYGSIGFDERHIKADGPDDLKEAIGVMDLTSHYSLSAGWHLSGKRDVSIDGHTIIGLRLSVGASDDTWSRGVVSKLEELAQKGQQPPYRDDLKPLSRGHILWLLWTLAICALMVVLAITKVMHVDTAAVLIALYVTAAVNMPIRGKDRRVANAPFRLVRDGTSVVAPAATAWRVRDLPDDIAGWFAGHPKIKWLTNAVLLAIAINVVSDKL